MGPPSPNTFEVPSINQLQMPFAEKGPGPFEQDPGLMPFVDHRRMDKGPPCIWRMCLSVLKWKRPLLKSTRLVQPCDRGAPSIKTPAGNFFDHNCLVSHIMAARSHTSPESLPPVESGQQAGNPWVLLCGDQLLSVILQMVAQAGKETWASLVANRHF